MRIFRAVLMRLGSEFWDVAWNPQSSTSLRKETVLVPQSEGQAVTRRSSQKAPRLGAVAQRRHRAWHGGARGAALCVRARTIGAPRTQARRRRRDADRVLGRALRALPS